MKTIIAFFFAAFFAGASLAQDQIHQQIPQADTTSGWKLVYSNPHYGFGKLIYFGGEVNICYAWAGNGTNNFLMRSTDKGITWDSLSQVPKGIIYFTSPLVGYSTPILQNIVWRTTDGGTSWTPHDRKSVAFGPIAFADKDTGLIFGVCCTARTTDAGETWKELPFSYNIQKFDASFTNSKVGFAVGSTGSFQGHPDWPDAGFCERTTDGGATWTQIYSEIPAYLYCCQAIDEKTLVTAGAEGFIGRTSNSGTSWDTIRFGLPNLPVFESVSFANPRHGFIVGTGGRILESTDSGKSWHQQFIRSTDWFRSVVMINDSIALVCGGNDIYRTTTAGNFSSVSYQSYDFRLQIYPNPADRVLNIQYQLPSVSIVLINIYNIQGRLVGTVNSSIQSADIHQAQFDASSLSSGAYTCRLTAGQNSQTISFTIQK